MLNQSLIPEFQHETANTLKMLKAVPQEHFGWRPHEKSMTLGRLASHVAQIPGYMTMALTTDEFNFANRTTKPVEAQSSEELIQLFEQSKSKALEELQNASDEALRTNWKLMRGDFTILDLPRIAVLRTLVMNHMIHHRGQLSVYLRLLHIPVPGMYGPSADEQ